MLEKFENKTIVVILDLCLSKTRAGKYHDYRNVTVSRSFVFEMFSVLAENQSRRFSVSSGLKSVFEELHFRDGLVSVDGSWSNRRNKDAFSNSSGVNIVWTCLESE